jgi:sterol desaturase/sphingolipid hydroxylase (fatty acid hydroxylase superfamily)
MNIKIYLPIAFLIVVLGNIVSYILYEVLLKGEPFSLEGFLNLTFIAKIFKFPFAALVVIFVLLMVEHIRNGNGKSTFSRLFSKQCDASTVEDAVYAVLGLASINRLLSFLFSFGIGFALNRYIDNRFNFSLLSNSPISIQFLSILILIPFFEYWHHRLMHTHFLWDIHKVHHAANHFNGLTTFRVHPLDSALAGPFRAFPVAVLGVRPDLLAAYSLLNLSYQVWVHSEVYINQPWLRRYLLIDPSLHRIHHSSDPRFYDKNFGILSVYDRMFGTWQDIDQPPRQIPIGFEADPLHNQGHPIRTMIHVFRNWLVQVFKFSMK